jgi:carbonic anhydrase/acetyltransferase-like protein (isoleucine patch superfamily)
MPDAYDPLAPFIGRTPRLLGGNYVAPTAAVVGDVTLGEGASSIVTTTSG